MLIKSFCSSLSVVRSRDVVTEKDQTNAPDSKQEVKCCHSRGSRGTHLPAPQCDHRNTMEILSTNISKKPTLPNPTNVSSTDYLLEEPLSKLPSHLELRVKMYGGEVSSLEEIFQLH
jgi:hypothetical protein